jgi:UDP-3-O-[3-hydroxymyristoyl] N-acetylglucosamine deacetylase
VDQMKQTTLRHKVAFSGTGLHKGKPARVVVHPSPAEFGIWFSRTDVTDRDNLIAARWDSVDRTPLCTKLRNEAGVSVSTVEHLMAALAGVGIHNAMIEIDGPEVPILDGSAAEFVGGFLKAGVQTLNAPQRVIRILKPVEVHEGDRKARLEPNAIPDMEFHIDFDDDAIGTQSRAMSLANGAFVRELCDSRTFCRLADVDAMRSAGLALGGTYSNAGVVDGDEVLSPGGMRHSDEPVRHKMLDAVGDLALAGAPIIGRYIGDRSGHTMTNTLLRALFLDPSSYVIEDCSPELSDRLPGAHISAEDLRLVA